MKHNYNLLTRLTPTKSFNLFCNKSKTEVKKVFLALVFIFATQLTFSQSPYIDNTPGGSESFTVPSGVTSITVSVWGAGGGGGGSDTNNSGGSGGGGGGATTRVIAVTPGDVFTYVVGTGGTGGLANATLAGNGTNSTFVNGGLGINMIGNGGTGGARNNGAVGVGGTASGGTLISNGQNGTLGNTSGQAGGNSGVVIGIFGGGGVATTNTNGNPGTIPGGGGGGGERGGGNRNGGAGANGQIHITYTCPTMTANAGIDQNLALCATTTTLTGSAIPAGMTGTWTVVSGPGSITSPNAASTGITNLVPGTNTTFRWTISNGTCGSVSDTILITTLAGAGCTPYCLTTYTTAVNPITNVTFANIVNSTSNVVNGTPQHEVFFTPVGQVERGEIYQISISGNTNGATAHGISAFFDWNRDGDFADAGERFDVGAINNVSFQTGMYIQVPLTATLGQTRMRVTMLSGAYVANSCRTGAGSGQTEDYILNINTQTCNSPTAGFSFTAIGGTTATINWTAAAPAPANGYDLYISPINQTPNPIPPNETLATVTDPASPYTATGLTPGSTYYVWIRGNCGSGDYGVWNSMGNFTTTLTNDACAGAITIPVNAGTDCNVAVEGDLTNSAGTAMICGVNNSYDVWYTFTATATSHRISVIPQPWIDYTTNPVSLLASTNLNFSVLALSCAGVNLGCTANNATSTETAVYSGLIVGQPYFIRVSSSGNSALNRTKFTVCVTTGNATHSNSSAVVANFLVHPTSGFSSRYINDYNTTGTLTNTVNMNSGRSITGYKNNTGMTAAVGVAGGGINIDIAMKTSRQLLKAWVDWNNDGYFNNATEVVYDCNGVLSIATSFGFVIPGATAIGTYRIRVRSSNLNQTYNYTTGALTSDILPYWYTLDGEAEDYSIQVVQDCTHQISTVTDGSRCATGSVNLSVTTVNAPSHIRWYDAEVGGSLIGTSTVTANASTWATPSISATTEYWATAYNTVGGCEALYRKKVIATINPIANMFITPSTPEVCGENNVVSITAAGDYVIDNLINENFNASLGALTSVIIGGAGDAATQWQREVSPYVPVGSVWKPAIISRSAGDGFAMATSDYNLDVNVALESAALDSTPYSDLTLTFRHYYSYYGVPYDIGYVEVSTDGISYTPVQTIVADQGQASNFSLVTINMNAYINQPILKVRFRYNAKFCDGWAVDDVRLFGTRPLSTAFSWSGAPVAVFVDAACTIPYVAQLVSTVYVKPTPLQMATGSWSFTATATLNNGCAVSIPITINNKTKLWKGAISSDWSNGNNWEPTGVPDANTCVIIYDGPNDSRIIGPFYDAFAKYVIVRPNGDLLVNSDNTLTITDDLNVEPLGVATFNNGSSLVQVNNIANTGNITYRRTANIRKQDYVYWSAPVTGFSNSAVSPGTSLGYQYKWLPTTGGINNFGNWTLSNESMVLGKGYCLRGPDAYSTSVLTNYTANFVGVPNNGDITIPISRGTWNGGTYSTGVSTTLGTNEDDNWNLVGNPYPSAIHAINFLTLNTNIAGFVNIWTHGTLPSNAISDPFYNDYGYNYTPSDYITYNSSGASSGPGVFNGRINAGQGFFVSMLHTSAATTENLTFNNTLRSNAYNNNAFYKTSSKNSVDSEGSEDLERHRIWFDIVGPSGNNVRSMLGYIENATNGNDRLFDAFSVEKLTFNIYSFVDNEKMLIQGRKLPFDNKDKVNIGVTVPEDGLYKIAISSVDGLFSDKNQSIYLEDKLLNVIFNLREAPYSFMATKGNITDRFVMRFTKDSKEAIQEISNQLTVYDNNTLTVESGKLKIKNIKIFDIQGKELLNKNEVNNTVYKAENLVRTNSLMIVKVTLEDSSEEVRKIIY